MVDDALLQQQLWKPRPKQMVTTRSRMMESAANELTDFWSDDNVPFAVVVADDDVVAVAAAVDCCYSWHY